jgi:hypothetical protein
MKARATLLFWCVSINHLLQANSSGNKSASSSRFTALAPEQFPNLTTAERSLLCFSDVMNTNRGAIALAGLSVNSADPSNDPAHADKWSQA